MIGQSGFWGIGEVAVTNEERRHASLPVVYRWRNTNNSNWTSLSPIVSIQEPWSRTRYLSKSHSRRCRKGSPRLLTTLPDLVLFAIVPPNIVFITYLPARYLTICIPAQRRMTQTRSSVKRGVSSSITAAAQAASTPSPRKKARVTKEEDLNEPTDLLNKAKSEEGLDVPSSPSKSTSATLTKKLKQLETFQQTPFPDYSRPTPEECQRVCDALATMHKLPVRPVKIEQLDSVGAACGLVPNVLEYVSSMRGCTSSFLHFCHQRLDPHHSQSEHKQQKFY